MTQKVSLSAQHIVKRYGGVVALADGNLTVETGEVVALLGANGSGKSTLTKVITGVVAPNEGQLLLDNASVHFSSPRAAQKRGITAVYQELSLIPDMTVAENIWLGREPMFGISVPNRPQSEDNATSSKPWWRTLRLNLFRNRFKQFSETQKLLHLFADTCSSNFHPDAFISNLSPDEQQIVEILKALSQNPRLMILDEATASLDSTQVGRLFELIDTWRESMALVIVSHRMDEIMRIADRATVLRNGTHVGNRIIAETTEQELVEMMIEGAADPEKIDLPPIAEDAPMRLVVELLRTARLRGVGLKLRDGELLGLGGLQGQGQTDLLLALFGAIVFDGKVLLGGESVHFRHPQSAMQHGLALVPGDRKTEGLLLSRSILENFQLPSWAKYGLVLNMNQAKADAQHAAANLQLVMAGLDAPVSSLSGGNAQKVVIGKWLLRNPDILLLNDPTKGVDVGAKAEFYALLSRLREQGTAIIFHSSDDEELLGLCDRVLVLHDGIVSAELIGNELTRANLVAASMGAARQ